MSDRIYDGPPIDATEQHISERPEIEYATDPEQEGTMTTTIGLPDHVEPSDEAQRKVLEAAADPTREWDSLRDLTREVVPEKRPDFASDLLRKKWPSKIDEIKDDTCAKRHLPNDSWELTPELLRRMRIRSLEGETNKEIAEDHPRSDVSIGRYINGSRYEEVSEKCAIPPVIDGEIAVENKVWKDGEVKEVDEGSNEEGVFEQLEIEIGEETAEETVNNDRKSLSEELAEATETTAEEIEAGADSIEIDDPAGNDDSGVRWRVAALLAGVAAVVWWFAGGRR